MKIQDYDRLEGHYAIIEDNLIRSQVNELTEEALKQIRETLVPEGYILVNPEKLQEAYENEISNQAIDHAFDFDNVLRELFGEDYEA